MVKLVNRAKMTTATTGTGTITLGTAESGYQSFADAGVVDTDVVRYVIEDGIAWEIGTGTYTASGTTLTRTVSESSNADAAINLTGSAVVYVSATADDIPTAYTDADVDTHLNTGTAASGEVLSWTGTDYDWVAAGGGSALELYAENPSSPTAPSATGTNAVAIGNGSTASGDGANAFGEGTASGNFSTAIGYFATSSGVSSFAAGSGANAGAGASTAIGRNSAGGGSTTNSGAGAMALGGSYASGTNSLAAAIANNTSSYGATGANSVAMGSLAKASNGFTFAVGYTATASGTNAVAIGYTALASGLKSVAIGDANATGNTSVAIGEGAQASGSASYAIGEGAQASGARGFATGFRTSNNGITGKYAWSGASISGSNDGSSQEGRMVLITATTDDTPTALTTVTTPNATNQVILPNNSAYAFHGTIVARQQASGGTACAAWKVEGLIRREGSAGTTVLVNSATTVLDNTPAWGMALSADTTNGGLKVEVTGAAATNIRWVATINTSEVTY